MVTKKRKKKRKSLDFGTKDSLNLAKTAVVLGIGTAVLKYI